MLVLAGCSDSEDRLNATVHAFADALSRADPAAAAALTTDGSAASEVLGTLFDSLGKDVHVEAGRDRRKGRRRDVHARRHLEVRPGETHRMDLLHRRRCGGRRRRLEDPVECGDRRSRIGRRAAVLQHAGPATRGPGPGPHRSGTAHPACGHPGRRSAGCRSECRCRTGQSDRHRASPRNRWRATSVRPAANRSPPSRCARTTWPPSSRSCRRCRT